MAGHATRETAETVIRRLHEAGHEALLAGGCVRDMLLGRAPVDYDVATSATPDEVAALFRRVLMVGAKFGVAMVLLRGQRVEVTTFRSDLSYADGRHPEGVRFATAREDALRRDFTVNGMFFDPLHQRVVDYVGGQDDLARRVIRAIGQPDQRFGEDYLRLLRAVRFAANLSFDLDAATAEALRRHAACLDRISGERVREELEKMLTGPAPGRAVRLMHEHGLLQVVLPDLFDPPARYAAALGRLDAVAADRDWPLALGALLGDLPADAIDRIVRRWGGSNLLRRSSQWLAEHLYDWQALPTASLAALKRLMAHRDWPRLQKLWLAQEGADAPRFAACWAAITRRVEAVRPDQVRPAPFVTGDDLRRMGLPEGPALGLLAAELYETQLNEELPDRKAALALARRKVGEHGRI